MFPNRFLERGRDESRAGDEEIELELTDDRSDVSTLRLGNDRDFTTDKII